MKHSRNLKIGPGGRRCVCCFPAPKSKERRLEYRAAKRKDAKDAMRAEETAYEPKYTSQLIDRGPVNFDKFEG